MPYRNYVTVARYSFPYEASIARAMLEAEGIDARIADEHTINMQWLYSDALGGIRLQVPAHYVDWATELLGEDFSEQVEQEAGSSTESHLRCPECGSDDLVPHTLGRKPAFMVFALLGFPLFFYRHTERCQNCGWIRDSKETAPQGDRLS